MGVALGVVFGADVGAPFNAGDSINFLFERSEFLGDVGLLFVGGVILELDDDDVTVGSGFFVFFCDGRPWRRWGRGRPGR